MQPSHRAPRARLTARVKERRWSHASWARPTSRSPDRPRLLAVLPMAEAIGYALNHWKALERYLEVGFLEIDNGASERGLRPVAVGRNNWLFVGSEAGGKTAAILMSLCATCKRVGIDPLAYLRDVLERISTHPASRIAELVPDQWRKIRAGPDQGSRPAPARVPEGGRPSRLSQSLAGVTMCRALKAIALQVRGAKPAPRRGFSLPIARRVAAPREAERSDADDERVCVLCVVPSRRRLAQSKATVAPHCSGAPMERQRCATAAFPGSYPACGR